MQVAPGVYAIRTAGSTAYLLGGLELTLVDAGGPGSAPRIVRYVRQLGRRPQDVTRILLTHVDLDHAGGLAALIQATGARILAHPEAFAHLRTGAMPGGGHGLPSWLTVLRLLFTRPEQVAMAGEPLGDGVELAILGGLRALFTGGHSPDHVAYYLAQSRLIFSGDLLLARRGHLQALPGPGSAARAETVSALRRLADLDPLTVLPGHGPPYRNNIPLRLARLAEILEE